MVVLSGEISAREGTCVASLDEAIPAGGGISYVLLPGVIIPGAAHLACKHRAIACSVRQLISQLLVRRADSTKNQLLERYISTNFRLLFLLSRLGLKQ